MENKKISSELIKGEFKAVIEKKGLFLNLVSENDLERAVIALYNRLSLDEPFNANITVSAESHEISNQYGEALLEIMEKFFPKSCGEITEKDLYDPRIWHYRIKQCRILMVKDFKDVDPEKLYGALSNIEKSGWKPTVILCTVNEGLERLKVYDFQDYRLYHYLCGQKICISDIGLGHIFGMTVEILERKGYTLKDDFREKMSRYIQAVYPEARLTKKAFVDDLIHRILQVHYQKIVDGKMLDASDVPYSKKAEKLMPENDKAIPKKETKTEDVQEPKKESVESKKKNDQPECKYSITTVEPVNTHFTDLENSKNILILSMSTLPSGPTPRKNNYCLIEDDNKNNITYRTFTGVSQLEPGTKFFISKLADHQRKPDMIIVFTTAETKEQQETYDNKSAVDIYCENIIDYIVSGEEPNTDLDKFLETEIKNCNKNDPKKIIAELNGIYSEPQANETIESVAKLREYIEVKTIDLNDQSLQEIMTTLNTLSQNEHVNLFIDLQGGSRTFMFTMFAAMTMLRDRNVSIKELFSIKFDRDYTIHPIEIVNSEYAIIDLVSGIRAFTRYGKVDELENFLENRKRRGREDEQEKSKEKELLDIMKKIDGCMQINDPEGFTNELEKFKDDKSALLKEESYEDAQFKLIVGDLNDTYATLIRQDSDVLDQIRWFGEKAFLTSALTFIEDKIPGFMIGEGNDKVFKVTYSCDMNQEKVAEVCKIKSYYRKENSIFNFGFTGIEWDAECDFNEKLCEIWEEKILSLRGSAELNHISNTLYSALFYVSGKYNRKCFKTNMQDILILLKENLREPQGLLSDVKIEYHGKKDPLSFYVNGKNDYEKFAYELWKALILLDTGLTVDQLDKRITQHVISKKNLNMYQNALSKLDSEIQDPKKAKNGILMRFAEAFADCRYAIDEKSEYDRSLKKNIKLYASLGGKYEKLCRDYFRKDSNGQFLHTVAGIRETKYLVIRNKKCQGKTITVTILNGQKMVLQDLCIRFYRALKSERNTTNHAEESTGNHMPYQYTKKAIFVFVELCRRLKP